MFKRFFNSLKSCWLEVNPTFQHPKLFGAVLVLDFFLFFLLQASPKIGEIATIFHIDPVDFLDRSVALLHAAFIAIFATYYLWSKNIVVWSRALTISQAHLSTQILLYLTILPHVEKIYWFHHILLILFIFFYHKYDPKLLAKGLLSEFSTIPLHLSWLVYKAGNPYPWLLLGLGVATLLLYAIFRIFNFIFIQYHLYITKRHWLHSLFFFPILLQNIYWFFQLVRVFLSKCF